MYSLAFQRRRLRIKEKEKNLLSAVLCMVVVALLSTAIAQPKWLSLKGGGCSKKNLGVYEFLYAGYFQDDRETASVDGSASANVYRSMDDSLVNCVTPMVVSLMRLVIAFMFMAIASSLFAFFMDTVGVTNKVLQVLRRNAIGSIFTVLLCASVIGVCYFVTTLLARHQELTKPNRGSKVEVKFDISFYLVTSAGAVAVLATAANLLRRYPPDSGLHDDPLLDELDGVETFSVGCLSGSEIPTLQYLPPPPPYTP